MKILFILLAFLPFLLGSSIVCAKVVTETVSYQQGDVPLQGYLAYDDGIEGKRPGVMVVHEWWGLNDYARSRARQLAQLGYVAFAVDMYGKGKVTEHSQQAAEWSKQVSANIDAWRNRALAGLAVLKGHPRADAARIAAIGYCFGGSTVQQLAYGGADIRGVVSFHGSLVMPPDDLTGGIPAKMLILHGAADPLTDLKTIPGYIKAMEKTGIDWHMVIYGGARHSFTNPAADKEGMEALGYSASADQRSWKHMQMFFDEIFGEK